MSNSPHLSNDVVGWRDALSRQLADNLECWLDDRPLLDIIDKVLGFSIGDPSAARKTHA